MIKSFVSDKVEIKESPVNGVGMFAKESIKAGEITFVKGGHILRRKEMSSSGVISSYLPIADDLFLAARTKAQEKGVKLYINHSCDPNCGLRGEISFVAMRDITKGEELTIDYAMVDNEDYKIECHCGSDNCRKTITGFDWKIKELQNKYSNYFAEYLKQKL